MQITIDLPDSFLLLQNKEELARNIKLYLGLMLYKQEKVSIGKAAEISGIDIYEFMKECTKNEIPVINISKEELQDEFEQIRKEFL